MFIYHVGVNTCCLH